MNDNEYMRMQIRKAEREIIRKKLHLEFQRNCRIRLILFALLVLTIIIAIIYGKA